MEAGISEEVCVGERTFKFNLCRKSEQFGPVSIDHWWMQTTGLYRQREWREQLGNAVAIPEAFWALCQQEGSHSEQGIGEVYILARLLPLVRNQGSRRVVKDAVPTRAPSRGSTREAVDQELEQLLQSCEPELLTELEFSRKTADVIGPAQLPSEIEGAYHEFCHEIFDRAVSELLEDRQAGVNLALKHWKRVMSAIGRRSGHQQLKQVLDILSYEARAALHQCYSAVWHYLLLPHLCQVHELTDENLKFLQFWHLDQTRESNLGAIANFHLYHGHVFALHPASGAFLRTATGRERMGQWLTDRSSGAYGRLLHGIYLATIHYEGLLEQAASYRKKQPRVVADTNLLNLEQQAGQRRRRAKHRPDY